MTGFLLLVLIPWVASSSSENQSASLWNVYEVTLTSSNGPAQPDDWHTIVLNVSIRSYTSVVMWNDGFAQSRFCPVNLSEERESIRMTGTSL